MLSRSSRVVVIAKPELAVDRVDRGGACHSRIVMMYDHVRSRGATRVRPKRGNKSPEARKQPDAGSGSWDLLGPYSVPLPILARTTLAKTLIERTSHTNPRRHHSSSICSATPAHRSAQHSSCRWAVHGQSWPRSWRQLQSGPWNQLQCEKTEKPQPPACALALFCPQP